VAFRSIATLSLSFGLVSIPVRVYSATESSAAIRFKLLSRTGQRVRREFVADDAEAAAVSEAPDAATTAASPRSGPGARLALAGRAAPRAAAPRAAAPPPDPVLEDEGEGEVADDVEATARRPRLAPVDLVKGYEFEKGRFVTFTAAELKALAEASRPTIDIVSFIPEGSVDPTYYDKAYFLAPDKPASKPYSLLNAAMQASGRSALAKWAWRGKEYVVQIRPSGAGLVLQQLLYADEVRAIEDLHIELAAVGDAELALALRLIEQIAEDAYDPERFVDEEKERILAAVERKIAGRKVVAKPAERAASAQVIDLVAALRASLGKPAQRAATAPAAKAARAAPAVGPALRPRGRQSGR
jgi:DNA end-binding protein Ku